jgi:hypothetical protein
MPKTMLVALWMRDTWLKQGRGKTNRMARLSAAVEKTAAIRKGIQTTQEWAKPDVVFIAPEYLFGRPTRTDWRDPDHHDQLKSPNPRDPNRGRHLDEDDKDEIRGKLIALSAKHPSFLLVPGTIAWSVRVKDHPALWQIALRRLGNQPAPWVADTANKAARLMVLQDLEARRAGQHNPPLAKAEKKILDNVRLCLNTAFVLYDGDVQFVYSKQADFYEVLTPTRANMANEIAVPGDKCGVFQIEGKWFGIEICYDHHKGVLHQVPLQTPPFMHLITSASVDVEVANCSVAAGGYLANAAADAENENRTGLWYKDPVSGQLDRVESPAWPGIRLARAGQRPIVGPRRPGDPASYHLVPDAAGSPLWVYRVDVP